MTNFRIFSIGFIVLFYTIIIIWLLEKHNISLAEITGLTLAGLAVGFLSVVFLAIVLLETIKKMSNIRLFSIGFTIAMALIGVLDIYHYRAETVPHLLNEFLSGITFGFLLIAFRGDGIKKD